MQSFGEMQSMATNMFSAYASVAASVMLYRSMIHDMIPVPVKTFLYNFFNHLFKHVFGRFFAKMSSKMTIVVDEQNGFMRNQIYDAAETYLRTKINPDTERLKVNKTTKQKKISLSMEKDQEVVDEFRGFQVRWQFFLIKPEGEKARYESDKRYFEVTFDKVNRDVVVDDYLPNVLAKAKEIKENEKAVKLYTRDCPFNDDDDDDGSGGRGDWGCINLDHPVTFDKLAMDPGLKRAVIEDLDRFVRRKDYYKKVGKAWKRGYLLFGPPGTGKSSLIAAMANYLRFDVYDLELTSIYSNSDLRRVLLSTSNKSILVIEDIDCNAQMHDREAESEYLDSSNNKLTLSGLLNFIDGLWSTCGDERIVIFTTNHKEKLDPALLRPGRMDMHIHMGYCTPEGFDVLAHNYLGIQDHRLFPEIKGLVRETDITPAEIAEHLMRSEDVDLALGGVIDLLKQKKDEKNAALQLEESGAKENKSDGHECAKEEEVRKKGKLRKMFKNLKRLRKQSSKGK